MTDQLPGPAAGYVRTANGKGPSGFFALFAEDAVVDDAGRIIRGREAIRAWAAGDIFAPDVALDALDASGDEDDAMITAKLDGTFDRAAPFTHHDVPDRCRGWEDYQTDVPADREVVPGDAERRSRLGAPVGSPAGFRTEAGWPGDLPAHIRSINNC
jgi:hypothetical protein